MKKIILLIIVLHVFQNNNIAQNIYPYINFNCFIYDSTNKNIVYEVIVKNYQIIDTIKVFKKIYRQTYISILDSGNYEIGDFRKYYINPIVAKKYSNIIFVKKKGIWYNCKDGIISKNIIYIQSSRMTSKK